MLINLTLNVKEVQLILCTVDFHHKRDKNRRTCCLLGVEQIFKVCSLSKSVLLKFILFINNIFITTLFNIILIYTRVKVTLKPHILPPVGYQDSLIAFGYTFGFGVKNSTTFFVKIFTRLKDFL